MAKKTKSKSARNQQPKERRSPFRMARDLFGETLGATRRHDRQAVLHEWDNLSESEQSFQLAQLLYLQIRGLGRVHELLMFVERWAERGDERDDQIVGVLNAILLELEDAVDDNDNDDDDDDDDDQDEADDDDDDQDDASGDVELQGDHEDDDVTDESLPPKFSPSPPMAAKGTTGTAPAVLARSCPSCGAEPGAECQTRSGNTASGPHTARVNPGAAKPDPAPDAATLPAPDVEVLRNGEPV